MKFYGCKEPIGLKTTMSSAGPRFECPLCEKDFSRKGSRTRHVTVVHENAGRFKCACGKTFHWQREFESHVRLHTDERPFQCMICQRKFISKSSLSSHHFDRHAEKNFGCGTCGLQFGRASRLQQHLATHLEKKFICKTCGKHFRRKFNLQRHSHKRHLKERLECQCGSSFLNEQSLKNHQARFHPGTQREASAQNCSGKDQEEHRVQVNDVGSDEKCEPANDADMSAAANVSQAPHFDPPRSSSPEKPSPQSSTICSANLKLVFDLEYRAPD